MGTIILTLLISVRIKLYKVSTSVGEFLACISGFFCFFWFFWSVLFSVDPLPPRLFLPCQTSSQSALPSEISFVQPLSSFTLSWLHISFFPLQMNYLTDLRVVPVTFAPIVYIPLSSLPGTSPSQSLPLLLLL